MKMLKKLSSFLLIGCMVVGLMTACGKKEAVPEAKVDMTELMEKMLGTQDDLPEMSTVSSKDEKGEELFASLSDVEYDKIQDYFFSYGKNGEASEIAVVFVKSKDDVKEVERSLKEHRESKVTSYQNYAPENITIAESAVVITKGNYVAFIMNEEFSFIKAQFESAMESE